MKRLILFLVILLFTFNVMCLRNDDMSEEDDIEKYYSAKEGLESARKIANNYLINPIVVKILTNVPLTKGYASIWIYVFYNQSDVEKIGANGIIVKLHFDKTFEVEFSNNTPVGRFSIEQFNIDSPEAYEIAVSNPEINYFLSKYNNEILEYKVYYGSEGPEWYIFWQKKPQTDEDYKRAEIKIDAITGELLYVRASE